MTKVIGRKSGKGAGGTGSSVSESPNTLQSRSTARLVEIISHGECVGLANDTFPLRSIYFDGVQAQDDTGINNYSGMTVQQRPGLPDQPPFKGFADTETAFTVGQAVLFATPRTYTISTNNVSAVRVTMQIEALSEQDTENGGIKGSTVQYTIESRIAAGAYSVILTETLNDKCTSPQQLSYRIDRPAAATETDDWSIRVTRVTPDATTVLVQNSITLFSVTELVDTNLQYADYAAIAIEIDSKQFGSSIPQRAYDFVGMVLDVPSNYTPPNYQDPKNPAQRTYSGLWDGTFKRAWCDNPAWILWAMLTDPEWGLGRVILPAQVDKWALYQIAQYCDEFVPDGNEGTEPRYTVNTQITSAEEAYAMLQSIASTFRGMLYWGPGTVTFVADTPKDAVKLVTPANVINGEFNYQGSSLKSRHSVARVTWNDPTDQFRTAVEVVEDAEMIERYGWRPTDIIAYGCTSRGQANRVGRWLIDTERYESEVVSYQASMDHADLTPGQIIDIFDPHWAGVRMGGRAISVTNTSLTTDAPVTIETGQTYTLNIVRPDGALAQRTLTNSVGTTSTLTWSTSLAALPSGTAVIHSQAIANSTQRVTVLSATTTSAHFMEEVTLEAGLSYLFCYTVSGVFCEVPINIPGVTVSTNNVSLTSTASPAIPLNTIAFVIQRGEGYFSRTISSITSTSVTLTASVPLYGGDEFFITFPLIGAELVTRKLTDATGSALTVLHWSDPLNTLPGPGAMWGLTATDLAPRKFRVMGVHEAAPNIFEVSALTYDPNKYDRIELGLSLPPGSTSIYQTNQIPEPPTNLRAYRRPVLQGDGSFLENIVAFWDRSPSSFVKEYKFSYRFGAGAWNDQGKVTSLTAEFRSSGIGLYTFSVIAVSFSGKESRPLLVTLEVDQIRPLAESIIQNIRLEGSDDVTQPESVEFFGKDLMVTWDLLPPADWVNPDPEHWDDPYFKDYRVRLMDTNDVIYGTYYTKERRFTLSFDMNYEACNGFPIRDIVLGISLEDTTNTTYDEVTQRFVNPSPPLGTIEIIASEMYLTLKFNKPDVPDYGGIIVWLSDSESPVPLIDANKAYQADGVPVLPVDREKTYYLRYAFYDTFGTSNLTVSTTFVVTSLALLIGGKTAQEWADEFTSIVDTANEALANAITFQDDTINNSYAILELTMRHVEDRGYLEDLTYDENGDPIQTVIQHEVQNRIDGDATITEVIDLIGAVSVSGRTFILNVDTVQISPTETMADRLTLIQSTFEDTNSTIIDEATTRADADTATATTISLLGAKTLAGDAFILNQSTVKVSPTESLATRLTGINTRLGDNESAITTEASSRSTADGAIATTISLIGAKNGGGTAFVLNTSTAQVSPGTSLASYISSVQSSLNGHQSSINQIASVQDGMSAKWAITASVTNAQGQRLISGIELMNNGSTSSFVIYANNFGLVDPNGGNPIIPMSYSGGVWRMSAIEVDTIKVNTITARHIIGQSISSVSPLNTFSGASIGGEVEIQSHPFTSDQGGQLLITVNVQLSQGGSGNSGVRVVLYRDGAYKGEGNIYFPGPFQLNSSFSVHDPSVAMGQFVTYTLVASQTPGSSGFNTAGICQTVITELKR